MSLNEIIDKQEFIPWQDFRVNDLNVNNHFNIDTTGGVPGDVLQLDGGLQKTWVPYSGLVAQPLDRVVVRYGTFLILLGPTRTPIIPTSLIGSPIFTITSPSIQINENASLLLFLNIVAVPNALSMPVIYLKITNTNGDSTDVAAMSPYLATQNNNPNVTCSCIAPVTLVTGDKISVEGIMVSPSTLNGDLIPTECSLSILRIN